MRYSIGVISVCLMVLTGTACTQREAVHGVVKEVRILIKVAPEVKAKGNPLGGALLGAFVAGVPGAIVGSAMEAGQGGEVVLIAELHGCKFFAEVEGKSIALSTDFLNKTECALLKKGDTIKLTRLTPSSGAVKYEWKRIEVEILPDN